VQSFGLPPAIQSDLPWWAQDLPLPLGLLAADHIVAVSPCYAEEIITPQFGSGLDEFLARRKGKISGILNGLDTAAWNPATDPAIAAPFDSDTLSTRDLNREHLLAELGFPPTSKAPLLGFIGRMDNQKGVDIAIEALRQNIDTRWHAVILGTGVQSIEEQARKLEAEFPERVRTLIRFDPALSRRIYAGADLLLIPSRYEPCGLAQMIAMRYGCVPVGRATGGLKDTIHDFDQPGLSTGFLFEDETPESLAFTLRRAFHVFADKRRWRALQRRGMSQDFSWRRSAREYVGLYEHLTGKYSNKSV
jgi:starch synthase